MLTESLFSAFRGVERPSCLIDSRELAEDEIAGIEMLGRCEWWDVTGDLLEKYPDAIMLMSPSAFLYYLPSVILATLQDGCRNLICAVNVVSMLDRTPSVDLWTNFFSVRWGGLNLDQLGVVREWLFWLADGQFSIDEYGMIRALENVDLLVHACDPILRSD